MKKVRRLVTFAVLTGVVAAGCGEGRSQTRVTPGAPPKEIVDAANLGSGDIHSGEATIAFILTEPARRIHLIDRYRVAFRKLGEEALPQVEMSGAAQGTVEGRSVDFNGTLYYVPSRARVVFGRTFRELPYRPEKSLFEALKAKFEEAQSEEGEGAVTACLEAGEDLQVTDLIRNPKYVGLGEESDDTKVLEVSASVDVPGLVAELSHLVEDPDCEAQVKALGLPTKASLDQASTEMAGHITESQVTFAIDQNGVVRKVHAKAGFKNQHGDLVEYELIFYFSHVNEKIEVLVSPRGKPINGLLRKFGSSEEEVLEAGSSEAVLAFLEGVAGGFSGRLP